jgi:hypothetical protein
MGVYFANTGLRDLAKKKQEHVATSVKCGGSILRAHYHTTLY